jgi:hypothetical protein
MKRFRFYLNFAGLILPWVLVAVLLFRQGPVNPDRSWIKMFVPEPDPWPECVLVRQWTKDSSTKDKTITIREWSVYKRSEFENPVVTYIGARLRTDASDGPEFSEAVFTISNGMIIGQKDFPDHGPKQQ